MLTGVDTDFDAAIEAHDAAVAEAVTAVWVGAEPTFTLRGSESAEWLSEPLGGAKYAYALRMAAALRRRHPGSVVLRTVGRQYAGEERPRWSVGLLERRDGSPVWSGPPDPLADPAAAVEAVQLDRLWRELERACIARGWRCLALRVPEPFGRRLLVRTDAEAIALPVDDERLARPSVHECTTPSDGLVDPLAALGLRLFAVGEVPAAPETTAACIELPAIDTAADFLACLGALEQAATAAGVRDLVLQGYPPPVDQGLAWTTITPDPAVVEVNMAPQPDLRHFVGAIRETYAVASALGLAPFRLQYNGTVSDSGGGGQFTLGGPSAEASPFFVRPALLPRLVRYLNHHPALSYLFAPDYVGSGSQSPRPDEGTRDLFGELAIALDQLEHTREPSPEFLWASLAPFLADPSGNAHRSELNIEKLWNPHLPGRGRLGLVEFRAFRMPHSPERAAAIAALLRALVRMLATADPARALHDWGDALHDRFALPFFLRRDLRAVFGDLAANGAGLDARLQAELLHDPHAAAWTVECEGCELAIERAVEFWPLVGDVASQESGGSRTVDSSTARLQISLRRVDANAANLHGWRLQVAGVQAPLHPERDEAGEVRLIGVRYRDFTSWRGLHPAIPPLGPLHLTLVHPERASALRAVLHNWHPAGLPYAGLPESLDVAAARRRERLLVSRISAADVPPAQAPPAQALAGYTLDLRRCVRAQPSE